MREDAAAHGVLAKLKWFGCLRVSHRILKSLCFLMFTLRYSETLRLLDAIDCPTIHTLICNDWSIPPHDPLTSNAVLFGRPCSSLRAVREPHAPRGVSRSLTFKRWSNALCRITRCPGAPERKTMVENHRQKKSITCTWPVRKGRFWGITGAEQHHCKAIHAMSIEGTKYWGFIINDQ